MGRLTGWMRRSSEPAEPLEVERVEPLEGTLMSLWNSQIPNWWSANINDTTLLGTPSLADKVWVANRCIQLNAQQIASMPLVFSGVSEPQWISSPDPNWYPNGIGDAIFSVVDMMYRHGFAIMYVLDRYADGFPRGWTVLDSASVHVKFEDGARAYKVGDDYLDPRRVVQIDRNPLPGRVTGSSAIQSYASTAWGLLAAQNQSLTVSQGGMAKFYLASERKLTKDQAETLQTQWMTATSARNGAPPVMPPEIKPTEMSFNPSDLALLETQEWNSRVLATAYGVPSVILNMSLQGGLTYQNPAALGEMWWRFELRTTAKRIADAFTAQMLPRGQWVTFDASDTFAEITEQADDNDPQASQVANASPSQREALRQAAVDCGPGWVAALEALFGDADRAAEHRKLTAIGGNRP